MSNESMYIPLISFTICVENDHFKNLDSKTNVADR